MRGKRFSLSNMQRKKGSKRIEMIIKMVNEFKLTVFHLRAQTRTNLCMCVDLPLDNKSVWASGLPGRRGPWTAGSWAAGLWRAVGRELLGRGLRAAGPRACF